VVTDVEVLRLHYAETLKHWRERFLSNRDKARELYDERFCRMWEFYLAASEASFRWQDLVVFQIQLTKSNAVLPMTRDYIAEAEHRLRDDAEHNRPRERLAQSGEEGDQPPKRPMSPLPAAKASQARTPK
jgi:cyclopropane-fatty-acyl-phospholipid synthase